MADTDVIGFAQTAAKSCFVVLHYSGGNLLDKEYEIQPYQDTPAAAVSSLVKQYYLSRGIAPKIVLLPMEMEDGDLFSDLMFQNTGRRTHFRVPQRGRQCTAGATGPGECHAGGRAGYQPGGADLRQPCSCWARCCHSPAAPANGIFDISNIAGTDIVASMVVFLDGRPYKKDYKRFKVEGLEDQDDYASMAQVVHRRFVHYQQGGRRFCAGSGSVAD